MTIIKNLPESFDVIKKKKKLFNLENFIPRRMSDHNKITFAIKYLPMSHLG